MKLGRLPRAYNPSVPHLSALLAGRRRLLAPPPPSIDYTQSLPSDLGMMGNDRLGDCVAEGTEVSALDVSNAYRSKYSGPIVRITTQSGKRLSVTPNHAVLTPRGFIRAKHLKKGCHLVGTRGTEIFPRLAAIGSKRHVYQEPSLVQEIFSSFLFGRLSVGKIVPTAVDFHGDAQFFNGDVDVVRSNSLLRSEFDPSLREPHAQKQISSARQLQSYLQSARTAFQGGVASFFSTLCNVSLGNYGPSFAHAHAGITQSDSLPQRAGFMTSSTNSHVQTPPRDIEFSGERLIRLAGNVSRNRTAQFREFSGDSNGVLRAGGTQFDASALHPSENGLVTDPYLFGNLRDAFPGLVEADRIVDIHVDNFEGHVYDLSTDSKWYVASGIISHNCTCAAMYHALQVWSANSNPPINTQPDSNVVALYTDACGYRGTSETDQGGIEQNVLTYAMTDGIPVGPAGMDRHKIVAFVEVDPSNLIDIKTTIVDGGVAYIGFNVPDYAMDTVGQLWDVRSGTPNLIGGHAVILAAYDPEGPTCITWGKTQKMTWAFFAAFTDEAYAIADSDWIRATGLCPAGLSLSDLQAQMQALKSQQS